ncbi:hypothetical protein J6590_015746 [Homalodisca vitripennis]|nr:hypothetical protein J6590_015746 [Homalodisca vitripennis]
MRGRNCTPSGQRTRNFFFRSPLSLWESEVPDHGGCFAVRHPPGMLVSHPGTESSSGRNLVDHTASLLHRVNQSTNFKEINDSVVDGRCIWRVGVPAQLSLRNNRVCAVSRRQAYLPQPSHQNRYKEHLGEVGASNRQEVVSGIRDNSTNLAIYIRFAHVNMKGEVLELNVDDEHNFRTIRST